MEIGSKNQRTADRQGFDAGGTGGQGGAVEGLHLPAGERLTSPSIATLADILQCLGISVAEFFAGESEEQVVFGSDDYFEKEDGELASSIEWIIPNAQKNMMEPIRVTPAAGRRTYPDNPHEGEEFGYVLKGEITIHLGKQTYAAKAGESFYYRPEKKHYISSRRGARLIWVSTPPSF